MMEKNVDQEIIQRPKKQMLKFFKPIPPKNEQKYEEEDFENIGLKEIFCLIGDKFLLLFLFLKKIIGFLLHVIFILVLLNLVKCILFLLLEVFNINYYFFSLFFKKKMQIDCYTLLEIFSI